MSTPIIQVDAFTDAAFAGNPAAVCILDAPADPGWMQNVAREMNLSETAFVVVGSPAHGLRWFTPTSEVDLCGHATLASAHVLFETGEAAHSDEIRFETQSGALTVTRDIGAPHRLHMNFPAWPPGRAELPQELLDALGIVAEWTGTNERDVFVIAANEASVRGARPSFDTLRRYPDFTGVCVTARAPAGSAYDFVSRVFAPAVGIDEDPVTGSAYAGLGPLWSERLGAAELVGYQASERGGTVHTRLLGAGRIEISGNAITTLRGELTA